MDEKGEHGLRRKAMRLLGLGKKPGEVLKAVGRSRAWLSKWRTRYTDMGAVGLRSQSRRPCTQPGAWPGAMTQMIARARQRLSKAKAGLIGGRAIRNELKALMPRRRLPSEKTIYRKLHEAGLIVSPQKPADIYVPLPVEELDDSLDAMDWTCRFLEGGLKVYAFHTLNLRTYSLHQTLGLDKTLDTAHSHVQEAWKTRGIPHFLQLDNDAIFCGGYKVARVFGQFTRLCLCVGVELIFMPFKEPQHNFQIEQVNGLWGGPAFWQRHRFRCFGDVCRLSSNFTHWYMHTYTPPALEGLTPAQAQRSERRPRFTCDLRQHIPAILPITAGRVHFIRRVQADGTVSILNETWTVSKALANQFVWATITTHHRCLDIWFRRSRDHDHDWRLIKHAPYSLDEPVHRRLPPFANLFTMS
jgi:putative transposase